MTKKLIRKIWDSTSRCYARALKEEYPEVFVTTTEQDLCTQDIDRNMTETLRDLGLPPRSHSIHQRYLRIIKERLTDEELNLIIEASNKGKIRRAGDTLDAISTELFERAATRKPIDE